MRTYESVTYRLVPPITVDAHETVGIQALTTNIVVAVNKGTVLVYRRDADTGDFILAGIVETTPDAVSALSPTRTVLATCGQGCELSTLPGEPRPLAWTCGHGCEFTWEPA